MVTSPTDQAQQHLKDYLRVISARRWLVMSTFVLVVLGAVAWVLVQTPIYRAAALLLIEPNKVNFTSYQDVDMAMSFAGNYLERQEYYQTQHRLLTAHTLLDKVYMKMKFGEVREFKDNRDPVQSFAKLVRVTPDPKTRLVRVTFDWRDPEVATRTLDELLRQYLADHRSRTQGITLSGLHTLRQKRDELRPKVDAAVGRLHQFMVKHSDHEGRSIGAAESYGSQHEDNRVKRLAIGNHHYTTASVAGHLRSKNIIIRI